MNLVNMSPAQETVILVPENQVSEPTQLRGQLRSTVSPQERST